MPLGWSPSWATAAAVKSSGLTKRGRCSLCSNICNICNIYIYIIYNIILCIYVYMYTYTYMMLCDIWLCGGTVAWRWDLRGRSCTKHCVCRVSVRWWLVKGRVRHTAVIDIHNLSSMELLRQSAFTIPLSVGGFCSFWYVYTMELLWVASVRRWCILVISLFLFAEVGDCAGIDWNCVKHLKRSEKVK